MSRLICVMGESGSGKTTAMRTLDPKTTYYVDSDGKGLAWKGWRKQYNEENKNFAYTRDIQKISNLIINISQKKPETKTIVIDTLNTCMVDKEVKGMRESGFGKWIDLTQFVWDLIETAGRQRDDLTIIFIMHSETVRDDFGYSFTRIKTNGRKLEKLIPGSLFGTVLLPMMTVTCSRHRPRTAQRRVQWGPLRPLRLTMICLQCSKRWRTTDGKTKK